MSELKVASLFEFEKVLQGHSNKLFYAKSDADKVIADLEESHNFDIHEHVSNVMLMVEHNLRDITDKYHIKESLVENVLQQMRESITKVA